MAYEGSPYSSAYRVAVQPSYYKTPTRTGALLRYKAAFVQANKRPCVITRFDEEYYKVCFHDDKGKLAESLVHIDNLDEWAANLEGMAQTHNGPILCELLYRLVPQMALLP